MPDDLTKQAIREKAEELEIDPDEDEEYMYIAREFLDSTLPKPWKEQVYEDPEDGDMYPYYVDEKGNSSWDHPLLEDFKKKFQDEKARRERNKKEKKFSRPSSRGGGDDRRERERNDETRDDVRDDRMDDKKERVSSFLQPVALQPSSNLTPRCSLFQPPKEEDKVDELDMEELDVEDEDNLGEVSLEESAVLSPPKSSNLEDSDSWSDVKSPVQSPSETKGVKKMKGQYLDDYMEDQDIGGRNDVKSSSRQIDSRASSRNLDSRGSTGYDTFTDSVVDEKHERRLERKREQSGRRSDNNRSRRYADEDSDESPPSKASYRSRNDKSSKSSLQTLVEEPPAPSIADPSVKYSSLRPEDSVITEMRRKNVDLEKEVEELQDIVEDWRIQKKKSEVLEKATTEELDRVKKVLRSMTKERDELSHSNALLTLKLNKNVANGVVDEEGEATPVTKFEKVRVSEERRTGGAKRRLCTTTVQ